MIPGLTEDFPPDGHLNCSLNQVCLPISGTPNGCMANSLPLQKLSTAGHMKHYFMDREQSAHHDNNSVSDI